MSLVARETAERAARRHAADEDVGVGSEVLHADAVAEERAVGERAGRVDGDDADAAAVLAVFAGERAGERALAGAGGAGDADDVGLAAVREELAQASRASG